MIEVDRTSTDGSKTGWIIARRYSEFSELLSQLKVKFPYVGNLDFPKKQLNRLKPVAEVRRPVLESFLRGLLRDERICNSIELRTFLSQNMEAVKKRHHKTVMENIFGLTDPREAFAKLFTMLDGPEEIGKQENPDLRQVHPAPTESMDEEVSSFAKPIVDLIVEAFDLRERSKWIKKRAVVLILQQILGGTIETRVRDQVATLTSESAICAMLQTLQAQLDKDGQAAAAAAGGPQPPIASSSSPATSMPAATAAKANRQRLQELAEQTLRAYNPAYVPDSAVRKLFRALQIETLNRHLLGKLMDVLVDTLFPSTTTINTPHHPTL